MDLLLSHRGIQNSKALLLSKYFLIRWQEIRQHKA